jgi:putative phosphoesterase
MTNILILADTQTKIPNEKLVLPDSVSKLVNLADKVYHAGDFNSNLDYLKMVDLCKGKLNAVYGNSDCAEVGACLSDSLIDDKFVGDEKGLKIGLVHGNLFQASSTDNYGFQSAFQSATIKAQTMGVNVLIFGHIHYPLIANGAKSLIICPGSPTDPRYGSAASAAWLKISKGKIEANIIRFESHTSEYQLTALAKF